MKIRFFIFLAFFVFVSACNTNVINTEIIKVIDHYEANEKNSQLGYDLLYYNYMPGLAEQIDGFSEEDAKSIEWEHFIRESDKQVSFRVRLSMKNPTILKNKETIIAYFKEEVEKHYQFHIENEKSFSQTIDFANQIYAHPDNSELEDFWSNCNGILTSEINKEDYFASLKQHVSESGPIKTRQLKYKRYIEQPINGKLTGYFVLDFSTEYTNRNANEQISLLYTDKWEVIGMRSWPI